MPIEDIARAQLESDSPLRPVLREKLRALWEAAPEVNGNEHIYWMVDIATDIGDLDLVYEILDSIVDPYGLAHYTVAYSPLFDSTQAAGRLRADPRFVELMQITGYPDYWRKYGWPNGCEADGDSLRCF
jgi:hypothetical protein